MQLLRRRTTLTRPFNFIQLCNIFHAKALDFFLSFPRRPVEPDTLSLLIIVTCNCLPFSYSRSIFRTHFMTSAENSASEPPNLKIFWGEYPQTLPTKFVPSAKWLNRILVNFNYGIPFQLVFGQTQLIKILSQSCLV